MALTDLAIRRTKARERAYKLYDEKGLYLLISPTGAKLWRLKYRAAGKEKTLALGAYPDRSLVQARDDTHDARKLIRDGVDPSAQRKQEKRDQRIRAENTFEVLAREWHANQKGKWTADHAVTMLRRLETHLFPALGTRSIAEIDAPELLDALRLVERKAETQSRGSNEIAHRMLQCAGQVFRYAIATGRARRDPSVDLRGALKAKERTKNLAALSESELPGVPRRPRRLRRPSADQVGDAPADSDFRSDRRASWRGMVRVRARQAAMANPRCAYEDEVRAHRSAVATGHRDRARAREAHRQVGATYSRIR